MIPPRLASLVALVMLVHDLLMGTASPIAHADALLTSPDAPASIATAPASSPVVTAHASHGDDVAHARHAPVRDSAHASHEDVTRHAHATHDHGADAFACGAFEAVRSPDRSAPEPSLTTIVLPIPWPDLAVRCTVSAPNAVPPGISPDRSRALLQVFLI